MADFDSMHIVEALRSGIPSRDVGAYFADARPQIMRRIQSKMDEVGTSGISSGMVFTGRYGEGKTHLLNTVLSIAASENMVVSFVPLGKETPLDKLHIVYPKVIANTYLPGARQPGFRELIEGITLGSGIAGELLGYTAKVPETDKLYFLLTALMKTQDEDDRYAFLQDLEGDFTTNGLVKKSYRRTSGAVAKFNQNFSKTKHSMDYFYFMSHLFRQLGYNGWVILFDEAELLGRLGKKTRAKCYLNMERFMRPDPRLEGVFTLFAMSSSYAEDVIDRKHEFENAEEIYADDPDSLRTVKAILQGILDAPELAPLTRAETERILSEIQDFHGKAYDWTPSVSTETLYRETEAGGYLLRTKIRAAIEFLDQLYQYGEAGKTKINELGAESYEEDDTPSVEEVLTQN